MSNKRPVFLSVLAMRFPCTAIASIFHRGSGVLLFLFIPFMLWVLSQSLSSPVAFKAIQHQMNNACCRFIVWVFLSSLLYHVVAGIRHLLMDIGVGDTKQSGKVGAYTVIGLSFFLIAVIGYKLW